MKYFNLKKLPEGKIAVMIVPEGYGRKTAKRKLRLKKEIRDLLGALLFYAVLVGGVIILNARIEYLNQVIRWS